VRRLRLRVTTFLANAVQLFGNGHFDFRWRRRRHEFGDRFGDIEQGAGIDGAPSNKVLNKYFVLSFL
jgi:hypothetical protein